MAKFINENILKSVFITIPVNERKQTLSITFNTIICKVLTRLITYDEIFKTLGKATTILNKDDTNPINAAALLPNGKILVAHDDGTFKFWDIKQRHCVYSEIKLVVKLILLLPGEDILTLNKDLNKIQLWRLDVNHDYKYMCYKNITSEYEERFSNILLLPNGNLVCSTLEGLHFLDTQVFDYTNNYISFKRLGGHRYIVKASVNLDGNKFATACVDIRIRDINNDYHSSKVLRGHNSRIASLFYIEKDKLLLSGSNDCKLIIWDLVSYNQTRVISMFGVVKCFLSLPNQYIALGYRAGVIGFMDLKGFERIHKIDAHDKKLISLMLLEDNKIVSSSVNETTLWEY
jgi:WD40 repeat protein